MAVVGHHIVIDELPYAPVPDWDGQTVAAESTALDRLCQAADIAPLSSFISVESCKYFRNVIAENVPLLRENFGVVPAIPNADVRWYPAALGVEAVTLLIDQIGRNIEALAQPAQVLGELAQCLAILRTAQQRGLRFHFDAIDPDSARLSGGLASRHGNYAEAIGYFDRSLACAGQSAYDQAFSLTERGDCWSELGDDDAALVDYATAIAVCPGYAYAWANRASVRLSRGDFDGAFADLSQWCEIAPDEKYPFLSRANAALARHDFASAVVDANAALELDDECASAYATRGWAYFFGGQYEAAADDFASSHDEDPDDDIIPLWRYLALERAGLPGSNPKGIIKVKSFDDPHVWPAPLYQLYLGKAKAARVEDLARLLEPYQSGEAHFFIAVWHLQNENRAAALAALRRAICKPGMGIEYVAARVELQRLGYLPFCD